MKAPQTYVLKGRGKRIKVFKIGEEVALVTKAGRAMLLRTGHCLAGCAAPEQQS